MFKLKRVIDLISTKQSLLSFSKLIKSVSISDSFPRAIHTSNHLGRKPGIVCPYGYSFDWAWKAAIPNIHIYTHQPLPKIKTGGKGPDGRGLIKHIGGGLKRPHFMVSPYRGGVSNGSDAIIEEKILIVHKNWWRPEHIALVARGTTKRWIYATSAMKVGDVVRSHARSDRIVSNPRPGDAYVLGCLPLGTSVCQLERTPGGGAHYAIKAGTVGLLQQKTAVDNSCLVKIGKRLIRVSSGCAAVVGQMSNVDHHKTRFTKFGQKRWLGIRQGSGLFQKKTGRFGRKVRAPVVIDNCERGVMTPETVSLTYTPVGLPAARRRRGTKERPVHLRPLPLEEGQVHPRFRWCSWAEVR